MWTLLLARAVQLFQTRAFVVVSFPIAVVFGAVGYYIEGTISDRYTPSPPLSSIESRLLRIADEEVSKEDPTVVDNLFEKKFVPKTVFEKNV